MIENCLIWIDVETTGLERDSQILEVGMIATDLDMVPIDSVSRVVHPNNPDWMGQMSDYVVNMHTQNGLLADIKMGLGVPIKEVEALMMWFYEKNAGEQKLPMCGSTVPQDRVWLKHQMPKLEAVFSHRHIDNSTIKELCRRYNPAVYKGLDDLPAMGNHRPLGDLQDTLSEARFYRDNFFFDARPV